MQYLWYPKPDAWDHNFEMIFSAKINKPTDQHKLCEKYPNLYLSFKGSY